MYLRFARRRKDGKEHRYWSIVESRRCAGGRVVQRPLLYLGEINDGQREAWCHQMEAFDEASGRHRQLALFPAEQAVPDPRRISSSPSWPTACTSRCVHGSSRWRLASRRELCSTSLQRSKCSTSISRPPTAAP